ncbi:MAG: lipopolysaccharide biosynthesis protein [Geobacteraceae bacterium GWC2_58_44]|nr:MAG: lipopolysaccharide biosynthesis protein [Geobacteraceae bacterium GWC2_58_44]HBG06111.1 lipopolysaccharide biosynthesis protein [Geobacter sp.]
MSDSAVRPIAFYLPQYHRIPENDKWWGEGFTEWTNVRKARPLFPGHLQPRVPGELGYYNLLSEQSRAAQADLARAHGLAGFCYWHYWFGGKRLLERPFNEVVRSGEPKFPFCLGWANESWTGVWHGSPGRILMEQGYPGRDDEERHFHTVAEAFFDDRYLTVDGKPIFYVYKPQQLPEPQRFVEHWQNLALKAGLKGIYFVGEDVYIDDDPWDPRKSGFDAVVPNSPGVAFIRLAKKLTARRVCSLAFRRIFKRPYIFEYEDFIASCFVEEPAGVDYDLFPSVVPNWDNSPRSGINAKVLVNSTPELFRRHLRQAIGQVAERPQDKRIVFIKSWNEWAEGNFLEPDQKYGNAYLEVCRDECSGAGT